MGRLDKRVERLEGRNLDKLPISVIPVPGETPEQRKKRIHQIAKENPGVKVICVSPE